MYGSLLFHKKTFICRFCKRKQPILFCNYYKTCNLCYYTMKKENNKIDLYK